MLSEKTVAKIRELLAAGHSQRRVAADLNVSRGTVQNIASKRWKAPEKKPLHEPEGERGRCPDCGSRTRFPCTYCAAVKERRKPRSRLRFDASIEVLGMELKGEEHKRYLEVKSWRERQRNPHYRELPAEWPYRREGIVHE